MHIRHATSAYEAWLAAQTPLVPADLALKHTSMAQGKDVGRFRFFRATFYRWAQIWPERCPDLALAPVVLAVGDLHIENFGVWRDAAGRPVWGVNDLDEAYALPYASDLARLATSVALALRAYDLKVALDDACARLLGGYADGLRAGGDPLILAGKWAWIDDLTAVTERQRAQWWEDLLALPDAEGPVPADALQVLGRLMPEAGLAQRILHRAVGVGSLGRQRWTAVAQLGGAWVAREVKALVPSACDWVAHSQNPQPMVAALLARAVRSPDPYARVERGWITRRLAPDSRRIDLEDLARRHAERLLYAMGFETANMHLGSPAATEAILHDLAGRPRGWLCAAAEAMVQAVDADWESWRE
jgi:hypothetical protein